LRFSSLLIAVGVGIALIGLVLRYFPTAFSWFGNLPGDIRYESETGRVFIPLTSMLVVSVVATVIINLVGRLFRGE
jgi:hypothetical protein